MNEAGPHRTWRIRRSRRARNGVRPRFQSYQGPRGIDGELALKFVAVAALSLVFGVTFRWLAHACGPRSAGFAFLLVWLSMCWVTLVLRAFPFLLPATYYDLRPCERDGRHYEMVGVLVAKRILRRGPLQFFNPRLHLPRVSDARAWRSERRHAHAKQTRPNVSIVL